MRELDLDNNLKLRGRKKKVEELKVKIGELDEKLAGLDVTHLNRDRQRLRQDSDRLTKEVRPAVESRTPDKICILNCEVPLSSLISMFDQMILLVERSCNM